MSKKEIDMQLKSARDSIDRLEKEINNTISQLDSQNNLTPIQYIKVPWMVNCKVRECESTDWNSKKYIRFDVPRECVKILNKLELPVKGDEVWEYFQFNYNTENSKNNFIYVLNAIEEMDKITEQMNDDVNQINTHTRDTILKMLNDIGVSKQNYDYPSPRSKKKEWINKNWYSEIFSSFPIYTGNISEFKKKLIDNFDKLYKADQDKRIAEEQKKKDEINRKETERQLAFMLAKYKLDITCDWDDLQDAIVKQNKYLYLAHYLMLNRGDWNDGYSCAEIGLNGFKIETSQDQEIYDCINNIITTYEDVDGRYFRDCNWNYDILYGIANKQNTELYSDYLKVREYIND